MVKLSFFSKNLDIISLVNAVKQVRINADLLDPGLVLDLLHPLVGSLQLVWLGRSDDWLCASRKNSAQQ